MEKFLLLFVSVFCCRFASGQVTITGPKCVLTSLVYQYDIKCDWKENDKINICVEGGVLVESGTTCIEKQSVSSVKVHWAEGKVTGKITVASSSGTSNISVNITPPFNAGIIQTTDKQLIGFNKPAPALSCTPAAGGTCSPSFSYQWEQSSDKLRWTAITGATGSNLSLSTPLKQTTFFRRKVFEGKSQTVGYSNEVTVFVTPEVNKQ